MKKQFRIQVRETGGILRYFDTLVEAKLKLAEWQLEDLSENAYTPDFYEIAELTLEGTYTPVES
jgi:hypothetical protein